MKLEPKHVARLKDLLAQSSPLSMALPTTLGGMEACDGFWRFYFKSWPAGGIDHWNSTSPWKVAWHACLPSGVLAFGEDVFGNQLIVVPGQNDVWLWNHENGDCESLHLDAVTVLTVALRDGIEWIELYRNGSLTVAKEHKHVERDTHLHCTTPLILGGAVSEANVSVVERESHLIGHAKLWLQICRLPPGTSLISS